MSDAYGIAHFLYYGASCGLSPVYHVNYYLYPTILSMSPINDFRKQLELYLFGILVIIAIFYGGWRAYPLVAGPHITIVSPEDGAIVASSSFSLVGKVSRVKNISIQGRSIPIDKSGNFNEILVAQAPYTLIVMTATDFYNKSITKTMRVIPGK